MGCSESVVKGEIQSCKLGNGDTYVKFWIFVLYFNYTSIKIIFEKKNSNPQPNFTT